MFCHLVPYFSSRTALGQLLPGVLIFFSSQICLHSVNSAEIPLNDANLGFPITAPHFFVAPIATELQRSLMRRDDLVAYAEVDASAFVAPGLGLTDMQGELCAVIRRAMHQLKPPATNGRLRIDVDYGSLELDDDTERLLLDIFRGMALGVGYAEVDAYGSWHNDEQYRWKGLSIGGGGPEEERPVKVGPALVYRVVTPLSRCLTDDADCLLQIVEPIALDKKGIFSDQELRALEEALSRLEFHRKANARVTLFLQEPDEPYLAHELTQTRQDSAFHQRTVELLKGAGFQNVKVQAQVGPRAFTSRY